MPELPDVEDYVAALRPRVLDATVRGIRITGISLLRTYDPSVDSLVGARCGGVDRLGKRIVFQFEAPASDEPWFLVLHLMVAGRLRWREPGAKMPAKLGLGAVDWSVPSEPGTPGGTLLLTEAGTKRRATLHLVVGRDALDEHDRGGIEPLETDFEGFVAALTTENRTLKRALTDPRRFSGIGNAYSDEILHTAQLSPVMHTQRLDQEQQRRLFDATVTVLTDWTSRLRAATGDGFPERVTAFRDEFAVHGKFGAPCPVCGTTVQRIRYADNETNYCPTCQTGGRVLADRSLSRLLKDDWPRTVDQLEGA